MESKRVAFDECREERSDALRTLDDDCYHHVFKYLTEKELCAVGKCSRRMNRIVEDELLYIFRTKQIYVSKPLTRIFKQYSPEIRDLILELSTGCLRSLKIKDLMEQASYLKKLHILYCFTDFGLFVSNFDMVLSSLTELDIRLYYNGRWPVGLVKSTMERCSQLEKLSVGGQIPFEFFQVNFPKLRDFSVIDDDRGIPDDIMTDFFLRHSNLIKLNIQFWRECVMNALDLSNLVVLNNLTDLFVYVEARYVLIPRPNEMLNMKKVTLSNFRDKYYNKIVWERNGNCEVTCFIRNFYRLNEMIDHGEITSLVTGRQIIEKLSSMTRFARQCPKLGKLYMPSTGLFLNRSRNVIIIVPELLEKLISERDAAEMKKLHDFNSHNLHNKTPSFFFTHFDEVFDLIQISFVGLSSLFRNVLMEHYPDLKFRKKTHIREAEISPTNENHPISSNYRRKRIFFSGVDDELTISRFTF